MGWENFKFLGDVKLIDTLIREGRINSVVRELKPGGQKLVYLVNTKSGNRVLKIMKSSGTDERALREIEILRNNDFYNVPEIYETFKVEKESDSRICIIEEYIEGLSLHDLLQKRKLSKSESIKLLETLLKTIVDIEKEKIVHRDIKPDNVLMSNSGDFHLIDFGIARVLGETDLTIVNALMCPHSPGYGAPELIKNDRGIIDIRADLFSIGVVVYESVTGKHPFLNGEENRDEIHFKTLVEIPKRVNVEWDTDGYFMSFLEMLMEKIVTKRPNSGVKAYGYFQAIKSSLE